ncbi:MAG: hypothetical protein FWD48_04235 [Oscillospiraceae bacterium]|nr:hypothetical protein [Oscillospiraceae bacterium]
MKILILEDRSPAYKNIKSYMESLNFEPKIFRKTSQLLEEINKGTFNENSYDYYILDLSCPIGKMEEDYAEKTKDGLLTGWIILIYYILKKDLHALDKCIIFSDYKKDLNSYIDNAPHEEKILYNKINKNAFINKVDGYMKIKKFFINENKYKEDTS